MNVLLVMMVFWLAKDNVILKINVLLKIVIYVDGMEQMKFVLNVRVVIVFILLKKVANVHLKVKHQVVCH